MKDYGTYRGGNPGQVVLNTRLGALGTFAHPFKGMLDGTCKVDRKDEVAVYLSPKNGKHTQVKFSKNDLRAWCQQVLEMLG